MEWNGIEWNRMESNRMKWNKKVLVHTHTRARGFLPDILLAAFKWHLALVVAHRDEIVFFLGCQVGHDFLFEELARHLCGVADEGLAGVFIAPVGCVMKFNLANIDGGGGGGGGGGIISDDGVF